MPNIEIHGFILDRDHELEKARTWENRIWNVLQGAEYLKELGNTLVSPVSSMAHAEDGLDCPYLRIYGTVQEELDDIVRRLDSLDVDIEVAPLLQKFIERRSVRENRRDSINEKVSEIRDQLGITPTPRSQMFD